jgi:hypothetical protein
MTPRHFLTTTAATLAVGAALGAPTTAQAQSAGCAAVDGFSAPFVSVIGFVSLSPLAFDQDEVVTLSANSVALVNFPAPGPIWNFGDGVGTSLSPRFNDSATPFSQTLTIPTGGITGLLVVAGNTVVIGGATFIDPIDFADLSVACTPVAPPPLGVPVGDVAQVTISNQHRIINGALTRTVGERLRGQSGNTASRGLTFLSTNGHGGVAQPLNAWVSLGVRSYFDRLEGETTHLTFGADYSLSGSTIVGAMVGIDQTSLENNAGQSTDSDSLLVGLYGAHTYGGALTIEAYLAHASVDYDIPGGASFDTDRNLAGLTLSGQYTLAVGTVAPRARLWGTWEDFPTGIAGLVGGSSKQLQASIGAEILYNGVLPGTALAPFASLDLEYGYINEVGLASDNFLAPRLGLGLTGALGGGSFFAAVDVGRSASDVTDVGLDLIFEMSF